MANTVISFTKKQLVLLGIGLVMIIILVSILTNRVGTSSFPDNYQSKMDSLNIELKYIKKNQLLLDGKIKSYKDSIVVYDHKIDSISKEITNIRIYYGKKIKDISNYTPSQLNEFFTNRYK